jgi:SAM-dependent methyltransferase
MSFHSPVVAVVLAGLTLTASPGPAQNPPEPQQGQAGKDVIWMPTPEALVERMLTMAQVTPRDVVYDLGSGDGRLVIAAAKRGAQAYGVEYNPDLVAFSENRARAQGMAQNAHFVHGDIFETDFSKATVVTLYLLSTLNMRLRPHLLKMRPGTRVVSHAFTMEDWTPDETSRTSDRSAYLWIVPAPVQGSWRFELAGGRTFDVALVQKYQKLEGTITLGTVEAGLREPVLRGDAIGFGFVDPAGVFYELDGTIAGDKISGTFKAAAKKGAFTAARR